MKISSVLLEATEKLASCGLGEPRREARFLLQAATGITLERQLFNPDLPLDETQEAAFMSALKRRSRFEPLAYIAGNAPFFGRSFYVSPDVLIPRPETEEIVSFALAQFLCRKDEWCVKCKNKTLRGHDVINSGADILDVGAGSGCLGLTIALELTERQTSVNALTMTDLSDSALEISKKNAASLAPDLTVEFVLADLWPPSGQFDLIVSNPPYVAAGQMPELMPDVRLYEPSLALDGGRDGLDFYRRISREVTGYLAPHGLLVLEHGCGQREAVRKLFEPDLCCIAVLDDLSGYDRGLCFCQNKHGVLSG